MSKYSDIFAYLRQCPRLSDLWSIAGSEEMGNTVILPQGASDFVQYLESEDVGAWYECEITPYLSVYEDYQINCFRYYDAADDTQPSANINVMTLDEVQEICDWVQAQNDADNFPVITGRDGKPLKVISVECNPPMPQIRYVDSTKNLIAYFITFRVRYVNPREKKVVEYALTD